MHQCAIVRLSVPRYAPWVLAHGSMGRPEGSPGSPLEQTTLMGCGSTGSTDPVMRSQHTRHTKDDKAGQQENKRQDNMKDKAGTFVMHDCVDVCSSNHARRPMPKPPPACCHCPIRWRCRCRCRRRAPVQTSTVPTNTRHTGCQQLRSTSTTRNHHAHLIHHRPAAHARTHAHIH